LKIKAIIIVLITIGVSFTFSPRYSAERHSCPDLFKIRNFDCQDLRLSAISGKIYIDGDDPSSNWVVAKKLGICTGNGKYSNPYVIEDLIIDGGESGSCIYIRDSDVYFKIENCTIFNSGAYYLDAGIELYKTHNGQIINNTVKNNRRGIYLNRCHNHTILDNYIHYNDEGIFLSKSHLNSVINNTADEGAGTGICMEESKNNIILGNIANYNTGGDGISLLGCIDNIISGNNASFNSYRGILVTSSDNNFISENAANYNKRNGICLWNSYDNSILDNFASYNRAHGICLNESDNNEIMGNTANSNIYGIYLKISDSNSVSRNTLLGNDQCIVENGCEGNQFFDNGECIYGQENDGIPLALTIVINIISGVVVISAGTLLVILMVIERKRKKID
jgi:parallel beta-helix repeat protein